MIRIELDPLEAGRLIEALYAAAGQCVHRQPHVAAEWRRIAHLLEAGIDALPPDTGRRVTAARDRQHRATPTLHSH